MGMGKGSREGEEGRENGGKGRGREEVHNLRKTTPPVIRWLVKGVTLTRPYSVVDRQTLTRPLHNWGII